MQMWFNQIVNIFNPTNVFAIFGITSFALVWIIVRKFHRLAKENETTLSKIYYELKTNNQNNDCELDAKVEEEARTIETLKNTEKLLQNLILVNNAIVQQKELINQVNTKTSQIYNVAEDTNEDVSKLHELVASKHHGKIVKRRTRKTSRKDDDSA
jgi:hypothetical protein